MRTLSASLTCLRTMGLLTVFGASMVVVNTGNMTTAQAHEEDEPDPAPGSTWEPETCFDDTICGDLGPLIPMTYNAVGSAMVWTSADWENPKIQYKGRHSEFKPGDVYDMQCVEAAILSSGYSAWPIPREEWAVQFPSGEIDPFNIFLDSDEEARFDPVGNSHLTKGLNPCIRSSFKQLVYGGYRLHQGQSTFVGARIKAHWDFENAVLWDLGHPDAFKTRDDEGVFDNALLDEEDALLNLASFKNAGASRNLNYSIYSLGYATLHDGRVVNVGGHNMNSNSGFRKLNIYDPETNSWADRPEPCNIANWRADPGGVELGYKAAADAFAAAGGEPGSYGGFAGYTPAGDQLVNPPIDAPTWEDCDQRDREDVDPPHPSDMRYQRWYPSGSTLPNGKVLAYGGDDLDESVGPDLNDPNVASRDAAFRATRIFHAVADVYDPETDTTVALESARKLMPIYPQGTIVETGPGDDDWVLCALGGLPAPAEEASVPRSAATNPAAEWRDFCTEPGCEEDTRAIRKLGTQPSSSLDCLDIQAAEADPDRNVPAENHWTHITTAKNNYDYCCGTADILKIGPGGETLSHKFMVLNGNIGLGEPGAGTRTNEIEMIDFKDEEPEFAVVAYTYQPGRFVAMIPLPDGTVLIRGGRGPGSATYEQLEWTKIQLFNPEDHSVATLAKSTFAGGIHKTHFLMPDSSLLVMGGDRHVQVGAGDRTFSPGDQDLGVSVAQLFFPPLLFATDEGEFKPRPIVEKGLVDHVTYKQQLKLKLGKKTDVKMVSMYRTGAVTHELHNDNRLVVLNFEQNGRNLQVDMPSRPAQAVGGDYMLFVVGENGAPSMGKHVRLMP